MHSLWLVIVITCDCSISSSVKALDKFISRTGSFLVEDTMRYEQEKRGIRINNTYCYNSHSSLPSFTSS